MDEEEMAEYTYEDHVRRKFQGWNRDKWFFVCWCNVCDKEINKHICTSPKPLFYMNQILSFKNFNKYSVML